MVRAPALAVISSILAPLGGPQLLRAGDPGDAGEVGAPTPGSEPPVFSLGVTASAWFASLSGYLQTSKGGGAGTTSKRRPEIDEIGLDGLRVFPLVDARFTLFTDHELHVNYVGIDATGTATLEKDLTSQAVLFPAGSKVKSALELDMIRFGYRYLGLLPRESDWTLAPEIGMSIDPFRYRLRSPTVPEEVDRSYTIAFPYLGLFLEGAIVGPLRAEIDAAGSAGLAGATFLDVDARLACKLLRRGRFEATAVFGLKGTWLRRRDHQSPEYNDIEVFMGSFSTAPWAGVTAGLRLGF